MAIKYRCFRCMKVLRADGTCQNPKCIRYVPDEENTDTTKADGTSKSK